jgi:hypothetical protein
MAVNFGVYEGHKILSNAMNNALNRIVEKDQFEKKLELETAKQDETKRQFGIQQQNWKKQFDEKIINDQILRNAKKLEIDRLNRETYKDKRIDDVTRHLYGDVNANQPITVGPDGNLIVADNASEIIDNWMTKSNYGDIMDISSGLTGDYGGNQLSIDDIAKISTNTEGYVAHQLTNIQKMFVNMDEDEIDNFLAKHENLRTSLEKYYIDIGAPLEEDETIGGTIKTGGDDKTADDPLLSPSRVWDPAKDRSTVYDSSAMGWGGGNDITFTTSTSVPTSKVRKNTDILLEALYDLKNNEQNTEGWMWADNTDEMELRYDDSSGKWHVEEDDGMFRGTNDVKEVRVYGGKAQVKIGDEWIDLSGSMNEWE